jgi:hypothetical protein
MKENGQTEGTLFSMDKELMKVMANNITKNTEAIQAGNTEIGGLVQRVEALKGLEERVGKMEEELRTVSGLVAVIAAQPEFPVELVNHLRGDLARHTEYFQEPSRKEIHYRHFLGWPIVVIFLMAFAALGSGVLMVSANERADRYSASDIKYRRAKLIADSVLLQKLEATDRKYLDDPDGFRREVIGEEQRRDALVEQQMEAEAKKAQIEELKKQKRDY